jgi:hypothetical protein
MLPLAGETAPTHTPDLADALQRGLTQYGVVADVAAEGDWPALTSLEVRLSRLERPRQLEKATVASSLGIARLVVTGSPVTIEGVPAMVRADFSTLGCGIGKASDGPWQLVVNTAEAGRLELEASKTDVEAAVHRVVSELAEKQGATVQSTTLQLTSPTPHSVEFQVTCTAKIFIASATLTVSGRLEVDDQLNARIGGLRVSGDGMIANMAHGLIQPKLAEINGRVIPLGDYVAAGLRVSDLTISTGDRLRLEATFGRKV